MRSQFSLLFLSLESFTDKRLTLCLIEGLLRRHELDFWKASVSSTVKWSKNVDSTYFTTYGGKTTFCMHMKLVNDKIKCKPLEKILAIN